MHKMSFEQATERFLEGITDGLSVKHAAMCVPMTRKKHYAWLERGRQQKLDGVKKGKYAEYIDRYMIAEEIGIDTLCAAMMPRRQVTIRRYFKGKDGTTREVEINRPPDYRPIAKLITVKRQTLARLEREHR